MFLTPRGRAVLRRHLFSEGRPLRPARASSTCCRKSRAPIASRATVIAEQSRRARRRRCRASSPKAAARRRSRARRAVALAGLQAQLRSDARRLRRRAEVSASVPSSSFCLRAHASDRRCRTRSRSCATTLERWPTAASTTSWAAASAAIRSMPSGRSRTSRRCSTTTGRCSALYADLARVTGERRYAGVARGIVGWLAREMRAADGAFYSSLDADSEGEEGKFYVWTREEARAAVSDDEWAVAEPYFGLDGPPNFEGHAWNLRVAKPLERSRRAARHRAAGRADAPRAARAQAVRRARAAACVPASTTRS